MHALAQAIESLLFVTAKPISVKKLAHCLNASISDVRETIKSLSTIYAMERGIVLVVHNDSVHFVTNPTQSSLVRTFVQEEYAGDLTKSAVETLSIIAYRGPITKDDIEHIRGIHCSIALRNLLMRGLIECRENTVTQQALYSITFEFLKHLGVSSVNDLPEYQHYHEQLFHTESEAP